MANYATNLFFASTKNQEDLDRIEEFLNENFCDYNYVYYKKLQIEAL